MIYQISRHQYSAQPEPQPVESLLASKGSEGQAVPGGEGTCLIVQIIHRCTSNYFSWMNQQNKDISSAASGILSYDF